MREAAAPKIVISGIRWGAPPFVSFKGCLSLVISSNMISVSDGSGKLPCAFGVGVDSPKAAFTLE